MSCRSRKPRHCGSSSNQSLAPQHLGHAPGLRDAAARGVGASASKISLIVPMHGFAEVRPKPSRACSRAPSRSSGCTFSQASTNGPISQRPDRSLVIGGVARAQVAVVVRLVVGMARRQRAQPDRRQQLVVARPRRRAPSALASRTGWSSEIAKIWFGRQRGSSLPSSPSTTS